MAPRRNWAPRAQRLGTLDDLGVQIVGVTVRWDQVAPTKPADQRDPYDPAYRWGPFAAVLNGLRARQIPALVTIWGAPRWANGDRPPTGSRAGASATSPSPPRSMALGAPVDDLERAEHTPLRRSGLAEAYTRRLLEPGLRPLPPRHPANKVAGGVTSPRRKLDHVPPTFMTDAPRPCPARCVRTEPVPGLGASDALPRLCPRCRTLTMARLP